MFNLAAPPQFRGLDPHRELGAYHRHLPHWRQSGATYFVTFRLADSIPQSKLRCLRRLRDEWARTHPSPLSKAEWDELARILFRQEEELLDRGLGQCWFRNRSHAAFLAESILKFQEQRYFVSAYTIMPNHCHLIVRPQEPWSLESILKGVKGSSARRINTAIGRSGPLWLEESYDRIIRDEEHLWRVMQYIGDNPRRAGLPENQWYRWTTPAWEDLGWKFDGEIG